MEPRAPLKVLPLFLLVVALLGLACGSPQESPGPGPEESPAATAEVLPTVGPDMPLVEYQSPDKGYRLTYPEGWEVLAGPGFFIDTFYFRTPEGRPLAQLTVVCYQGEEWTIDALASADAAVGTRFSGFASKPSEDIEIDGSPAKVREYSFQIAGLSVEHVVAYMARGGCGWRVGLNSWGANSLAPYLPVFRRVLASFRFQ